MRLFKTLFAVSAILFILWLVEFTEYSGYCYLFHRENNSNYKKCRATVKEDLFVPESVYSFTEEVFKRGGL